MQKKFTLRTEEEILELDEKITQIAKDNAPNIFAHIELMKALADMKMFMGWMLGEIPTELIIELNDAQFSLDPDKAKALHKKVTANGDTLDAIDPRTKQRLNLKEEETKSEDKPSTKETNKNKSLEEIMKDIQEGK